MYHHKLNLCEAKIMSNQLYLFNHKSLILNENCAKFLVNIFFHFEILFLRLFRKNGVVNYNI